MFLRRTKNSKNKNAVQYFLATLIVAWQILVPMGPVFNYAAVNAANVPLNETGISSFGFVLGGSYTELGGQPTATGTIKNGNVGAYVEGACIPSILEVTNNSDSSGDILVSPIYDFLNNNTAIVDLEYITDNPAQTGNALDDPRSNVDNLNDFTYTGSSLTSATSFASSDGSVSAAVTGAFAGEDATTTATSESDTFRHYNILLSDVAPDETVYVSFCARLGLDSSEYNGSSLSIRTAQGGKENIPIPVNQLLRRPQLTITKQVVGGSADPSDFTFNVSPAINGDTLISIPEGADSVTIDDIFPDGEFTITENSVAGYSFDSGDGTNCTFLDSTATATLEAAKNPTNATCIFTNTQNPGSITIVKDANPNSDQDFNFTATGTGVDDFALDDDDDGTLNNSVTFNDLEPGQFIFSEQSVDGWELTDLACNGSDDSESLVNATATVNLQAGEDVTCTFTNTQDGKIEVTKQTNPDGDQTVFNIEADGTGTVRGSATGTITDDQTVTFDVTPGTYDITETVPEGWTLSDTTCEAVVVAAGQTATCTLENTKLGTLTVLKDANPNGEQNFDFNVDGPSVQDANFTLVDDADNTEVFTDLLPGTYNINESGISGWDLTSIDCGDASILSIDLTTGDVSVDLAAGDEITCTYTNTQRGSISGTKYEADADGSIEKGTLAGWTIQLLLDGNVIGEYETEADGYYEFTDLQPGNYSVVEMLMGGWTQIFAPSTITLDAGETDTGNDFGNFKNGSIGGIKYADLNGNGAQDDNEPELENWEFTLYLDGANNEPEDGSFTDAEEVASITTNGSGFLFENLEPGYYQVCETQQEGWTRTDPASSDCRIRDINTSGETNNLKFGNQPLGTITVIKNVDTDGDGDIDEQDVTDWNWILNSGEIPTGSENNVEVVAFDTLYSVKEVQKPNFHVTASSCSGEVTPDNPTEQLFATVSPGEDVICTFTNTRDTGTITVVKGLETTDTEVDATFSFTSNDSGVAGDIDVVDAVVQNDLSLQVPTGSYTSTEVVANGWDLTGITCSDNNSTWDLAQASATFNVETDESVTCTFTNTQRGELQVTKTTYPSDSTEEFDITASGTGTIFGDAVREISDGETVTYTVTPGTYNVTEDVPEGWALTNTTCEDDLVVAAGAVVTCELENTQLVNLTINKVTDPGEAEQDFDFTIVGDKYEQNFTLDTDSSDDEYESTQTIENLLPGIYTITEEAADGWYLSDLECSIPWGDSQPEGSAGAAEIKLTAGSDPVECTFTNTEYGNVIIEKKADPVETNAVFMFSGDLGEFLTNGSGEVEFNNLKPGTYDVTEESAVAWDLVNITCSDDDSQTSVEQALASIELAAGETVRCVFSNTQWGELVVQKTTEPGDSQQAFDIEITSDDESNIYSPTETSVTNTTDASFDVAGDGTYSVTEDVPEGWDMTENTCSEVYVAPGATEYCEITNVQRGEVVIIKNVNTVQDDDLFNFEFTSEDSELLNTVINGNGQYSTGENSLVPGSYDITEVQQDGWYLGAAYCYTGEVFLRALNGYVPVEVNPTVTAVVQPGETTYCVFSNYQESDVVVTKFQDIYVDGQYNEEPQEGQLIGDPVLNDWEVQLMQPEPVYEETARVALAPIPQYSESGLTGSGENADGQFVFSGLRSGPYKLSETMQDGWTNSAIYCDELQAVEREAQQLLLSEYPTEETESDQPNTVLYVAPGQTLNCYIGNYPDSELVADKNNNQTEAQLAGETVTYTLELSVPTSSNSLFDVIATDTPPAGFSYVDDSYTASSSVAGHDVEADIQAAGGPDYDGTTLAFNLGTMLPGEVVTIVYQMEIGVDVEPGEYTNTVVASAQTDPEDEDSRIPSNEAESTVTVYEPQVLGEQAPPRILPVTGNELLNALLLPIILGSVYYIYTRRRELQG